MRCHSCHKKISESSVYCIHCGKQNIRINRKPKDKVADIWASLSILMFLIAIFGCDLVLAYLLNSLNAGRTYALKVGICFYVMSIIFSFISLLRVSKTQERYINQRMLYALIALALFLTMSNVNQIYL